MIAQSQNKLKYTNSCFLVLIASLIWGGTGIVANYLYRDGFTFYEVTAIRIFTTFLFSCLFKIRKTKTNKFARKDVLLCSIIGFCVAAFMLCYFATIQLLSVAVAVILLYTAPIFVVILSAIFFKEKIGALTIFAVLLSIVGCFFISGIFEQKAEIKLIGLILGLLSGVGYAMYIILTKVLINKKLKDTDIMFVVFLFSSLFSFPFLISAIPKIVSDIKIVCLCLSIGGLCGFLPYLLYSISLNNLSSTTASIIVTTEPLFAAILSFLIFQEKLSIFSIMGFSIIICSILLILISNKRRFTNERQEHRG